MTPERCDTVMKVGEKERDDDPQLLKGMKSQKLGS